MERPCASLAFQSRQTIQYLSPFPSGRQLRDRDDRRYRQNAAGDRDRQRPRPLERRRKLPLNGADGNKNPARIDTADGQSNDRDGDTEPHRPDIRGLRPEMAAQPVSIGTSCAIRIGA